MVMIRCQERKDRKKKFGGARIWQRGRGIIFRPYPGLGIETTMERPAPKIPPPNLVAVEKVAHFNDLFVDNGKTLEELMKFTKDPKGG